MVGSELNAGVGAGAGGRHCTLAGRVLLDHLCAGS